MAWVCVVFTETLWDTWYAGNDNKLIIRAYILRVRWRFRSVKLQILRSLNVWIHATNCIVLHSNFFPLCIEIENCLLLLLLLLMIFILFLQKSDISRYSPGIEHLLVFPFWYDFHTFIIFSTYPCQKAFRHTKIFRSRVWCYPKCLCLSSFNALLRFQ